MSLQNYKSSTQYIFKLDTTVNKLYFYNRVKASADTWWAIICSAWEISTDNL